MIFEVNSSNIRGCGGVEFHLKFQVGGRVASGLPGDPNYTLFCEFLEMSVRISDDWWIELPKESDALDCIGEVVMEKAKNVAVHNYLMRGEFE